MAEVKIATRDGLAGYKVGKGAPLLLMPYPHGYTTQPAAEGPLAGLLAELEYRVLTFDPPGAFRSTRPPRIDMEEMLQGARETLQAAQVSGAIDLVGHSMGGLCALAYTLEHPEQVRRLILIASISGGPAVQRCKGMPWNWRRTSPDFWRFVTWGIRLSQGRGNLALHKQMVELIRRASLVNKSLAGKIPLEEGDRDRPAPPRDRWPVVARRIDYQARLGEVQAPTLVLAGRFDPQAPPGCSQELAAGIPNARLVIFENSGHYPYLEEKDKFTAIVGEFLHPAEDPRR